MATISIGTPADKARLLHTLVLGFSAVGPDDIRRGVDALAQVLRAEALSR